MRWAFILMAAIIAANSAHALESNLSARSSLPPAELWTKIGDFCGTAAWDPAVEQCDLSDDGKRRTVRYFGGISAVAVLTDWDNTNHGYSWTNTSLPAPLSNYRATIRVIADGRTSILELTASYDANGVSDAEARKIVDGAIYRALCVTSPLRCADDRGPLTPAEVVAFDGLSATSRPLTLRGYLRRPDSATPSPAVVLLHGCGGFPEPLDED